MSKSKPMTEEVKALHKRLIPANVIMAIVGFVAAICTLFMPWLDLRISINGGEFAKMLSQSSAAARVESVQLQEEAGGETATTPDDELVTRMIADSIAALPADALTFPINIYPMKLLGAATGDEHDIATFVVSLVGKDGIVEYVKQIVNNLIPVFAATVVNEALNTVIDEALNESDLSEEDKALVEEALGTHTEKVSDVITTLTGTADTPSNPEKAKEEFKDLVSNIKDDKVLNEKLGDFDIPEEELDEVFDQLIDAGTKDGKFDISHLLSNLENLDIDMDALGGSSSSSGSSSGNGDGNNDSAPPVDSLGDLAPLPSPAPQKVIISAMEEETTTTPEQDELQDILDLLNDPQVGLENALKDSGIDFHQFQPYLLIVFFALMGLPALCWLAFALFATAHIFTQKKTTRTWYVKIFGFISAFTIVLLNLLPSLLFSIVGAGLGSSMNFITIKFLGSGVVVAICWAVLVLLGWFYYKPLKKKIKLATAAADYATAHGYSVPISNINPTVVNAPSEEDEDEYLDEEESEEKTEETEAPEKDEEDDPFEAPFGEAEEQTAPAQADDVQDEVDETDDADDKTEE